MLLVYPPLSRSTEPPIGVARLAGALRAAGIDCACLDLCQEGFEYLLRMDFAAEGRFSIGAKKRRERSLSLIGSPAALENRGRYDRAARDLNRCLAEAGRDAGLTLSLTDYQDSRLSPLRREDLLASARDYGRNIFFPLFRERLAASMEGRAWIGVSLCYLSQALPAFALMGYARERYPGARIVLGGSLVGSWAGQGLLREGEDFGGLVDAVIPGAGERPLLELLSGGAAARPALAPPDFSDFAGLGYMSPKRILPYHFSTGCSWRRCRFCPEYAEGRPYAALEPEAAMREISLLVEHGAPDMIHFTDSEIGGPFLRRLAEAPPGPLWYGFARASGDLLDPLFCRRLAASGCAMLQLGIESGDQAVLNALGKGIDLGDVGAILANLEAAGIGVFAYFLFGTRAEDLLSARRTLAFAQAHAHEIDFLNLAVFNLPSAGPDAALPGTRAFSSADLSLYREFDHPAGWNRDSVRAFLSDEFETAPLLRPSLRRLPPYFTSSHAAFFLPREKAARRGACI